MKRFALGLLIGLLVVPFVLYKLALYLPTHHICLARTMGDTVAHKMDAASKINNPKIILASGSNALYGFSSKYLAEEKKIRSVNLGLHAGFGLHYILTLGLRAANKGDLLVLPLEYPLYGKEKYDNALSLQVLVDDQPYFHSLPLIKQAKMIANISTAEWLLFLRNRIKPDPAKKAGCEPYKTTSLGDIVENDAENLPPRTHQLLKKFKSKDIVFEKEAKETLLWFARQAQEKGVNIALTYPNLLKEAFDREKNKAFFEELTKFTKAHNITLIGTPEERIFTIDQAYNTAYHPDKKRQIENSDILLKQLKKFDLGPFHIKKSTRLFPLKPRNQSR